MLRRIGLRVKKHDNYQNMIKKHMDCIARSQGRCLEGKIVELRPQRCKRQPGVSPNTGGVLIEDKLCLTQRPTSRQRGLHDAVASMNGC